MSSCGIFVVRWDTGRRRRRWTPINADKKSWIVYSRRRGLGGFTVILLDCGGCCFAHCLSSDLTLVLLCYKILSALKMEVMAWYR